MGHITTIAVTGMSCGHCVAAVTDELSALASVRRVDVVLETGVVTIASDGPLHLDDISAAVADAGYDVSAST
jgi:copper chaperone